MLCGSSTNSEAALLSTAHWSAINMLEQRAMSKPHRALEM
jgi:hypothetical protein